MPLTNIVIRDIKPSDVEAYIHLAQISFASDPGEAEQTATRFRSMARANMVPFKVLTWLTQQKWAVLVATNRTGVVGSASLIGTSQAFYLMSLMVLPDYHRQGVGPALIQAALQRAAQRKIPVVYASILANNRASLGAFGKNGFSPYHTTFSQKMPLPLGGAPKNAAPDIRCRPITSQDRSQLETFEAQALGSTRLTVEVSIVKRAYSGVLNRIFQRWLLRRKSGSLILEEAGQITGFARFFVERGEDTGIAWFETMPAISLPGWRKLLNEVAQWHSEQGATFLNVVATQPIVDLDNELKPEESMQHWYRRL